MSLSRETIVAGLGKIVGPDRVVTDIGVLKASSMDRFRKLQSIFGIYPLPLPAAVVRLADVQQVSEVLKFLNDHRINCVPRTGGSATEGGLETIVENSVVLDGSGDAFQKVGGGQHPRFDPGGPEVLGHGVDLGPDNVEGDGVDGMNTHCVLGGDGR